MNKRILLGVDAPLSPATQQALRTVGELIEQAAPLMHLFVLHVIPVPTIASPALGMYVGHVQHMTFTPDQRVQAELVLRKVRAHLLDQGITPGQVQTLIRVGTPADEITKAARELEVDFIVIGSRGNSARQTFRRFVAGSTSRRIMALASCPVMVVTAPPPREMKQPGDLVNWYEESITRYLHEHTGDLTVFTPQEVAQLFAPPSKKTPGRKERAAAILALEELARNGVLCRHDIKGELRYVND